MQKGLRKKSMIGMYSMLPKRTKELPESRIILMAKEKRSLREMDISVPNVQKIEYPNLQFITKMVMEEVMKTQTMTMKIYRRYVGPVMQESIQPIHNGQEITHVVEGVGQLKESIMQKDFVGNVIWKTDDIVWSSMRVEEFIWKRYERNIKRDEIEKAMAGANSSGDLDSGVTSRVISTVLTWRQETKSPVMLVATANDVKALPSMIYRKGRMDEIWATDLPTESERVEIVNIHLKKRKRDPEKFNVLLIAAKTDGFVGSEIESVIEDAMFSAFSADTEVETRHILKSIAETIPQSKRNAEEINQIREWVKTRARLVSGGDTSQIEAPKKVRNIRHINAKNN